LKKEIDIKRLSRLANIELGKEEEKKLQEDLDKIIIHIRKIQEVNVKMSPDATHLMVERLPLRDDKKEKSLSVKEVLANTEKPSKNHFTINRIINEDDY
jgi:aspartyl/glutamyl-tRNA(Asn/Gln) amidotransferase C subunit